MILVEDILPQVKKVLGTCDEATAYSVLNEAIVKLGNLGRWNPVEGLMDICTDGDLITLPDDVAAPLAINVGGQPKAFHDRWFEFHLNGPGSDCNAQCCSYGWDDQGMFPTFRSLIRASTVYATPDRTEEVGSTIRVYGYQTDADGNDQWVMTEDSNGNLVDGEAVTLDGSQTASTTSFRRITRILKPVTNGFVRLWANDSGSDTGKTLLGYFRPSEKNPTFRRIRVSGAGCPQLVNPDTNCCQDVCTNPTDKWVRMRYRRRSPKVTSGSDVIFLHSDTAIKMAVKAIMKYENDLLDEYAKYIAAADQCLQEANRAENGPNQPKIQFLPPYGFRRGDNMV